MGGEAANLKSGTRRARSVPLDHAVTGARPCLLVYDVTRRESFDPEGGCRKRGRTCEPRFGADVMGNKADLESKADLAREGKAFADLHGMLFVG